MDVQRRSTGRLLLHGIIGGIVAGIIFAMADMVMAVVVMGASFFAPLRMIGAMVLGQVALVESYPLAQAAIAGIVVHMMLSAIFGLIFVYLLALARQLDASTGLVLLYGFVFGVVLWGELSDHRAHRLPVVRHGESVLAGLCGPRGLLWNPHRGLRCSYEAWKGEDLSRVADASRLWQPTVRGSQEGALGSDPARPPLLFNWSLV